MRLDPNEEQLSLLEAVDRVIGSPGEPQRCVAPFVYDRALESRLDEGGFLDLIGNGCSLLDATLIALTIARLPTCVEATTTLLLKPLLPAHFERPIAFMRAGQSAPVRYLPVAKTVVVQRESDVCALALTGSEVHPVEGMFAFPYGELAANAVSRAEPFAVAGSEFEARAKLVIAVDLIGAMQGALDRTVQQVKDRRQFGRPIGAFQAVQHRLAVATQVVAAGRLLTCRAAHSGTAVDCAMALGFAQHHTHQLAYDFHQFSGAMGLTLEYPLHLWTYRMRALVSEYGGAAQQATVVSDLSWPLV